MINLQISITGGKLLLNTQFYSYLLFYSSMFEMDDNSQSKSVSY